MVDPDRFVAVSFDKNTYVDTDLSHKAMTQCRDYLAGQGQISVSPGFQNWDLIGDNQLGDTWFGRLTRMRATDLLCAEFNFLAIERNALTIPKKDLIRIKELRSDVPPVPPVDVEESRKLLTRVNARLATTCIDLAPEARSVVSASGIDDEGEGVDTQRSKRRYAGDRTAVAMYRSFKGDWNSGGRIYGGWWMSEPSSARPYITIDGAELVEVDYASLHPRMLFHRAGLPMDFDPYVVPGIANEGARELGKRTFNRLLNRDNPRTSQRTKLRAAPGDPNVLPKGISFARYRSSLCIKLHPIQNWFGTGEGVRLQREDSDLAIAVMSVLEDASIPVLPIHDSFLVPVQHKQMLKDAMINTFMHKYGFPPLLKEKHRPSL